MSTFAWVGLAFLAFNIGLIVLMWKRPGTTDPWSAGVGRFLSLRSGFYAGYVINLTLLLLEFILCMIFPTSHPWFLFAGVAIISIAYFGLWGITTIETGIEGALVFLFAWVMDPSPPPPPAAQVLKRGKGVYWTLPPPFGGFETIEIRERVSRFGFVDEKTAAVGFKIYTNDGIVHQVFGSITWFIEDIAHVLTHSTKPIHEVLKNLAQEEIKQDASGVASDVFCNQINTVANQTAERIKAAMAAVAAAHGVRVELVQITQVDPPKSVVDAKAKVAQERAEKEAEEIEIAHVTKMVQELRTKNKKLSHADALRAVMAERGKLVWKYDDYPTDYSLDIKGLPDGLTSINVVGAPGTRGPGSGGKKKNPNSGGGSSGNPGNTP